MTVYLRNATSFMPKNEQALDLHTDLPPGNFVIKSTPLNQLYFEMVDSFTLPTKLYGNTGKIAEKIINTYIDRGVNTGTLLSGEKGSGKTLLAKTVSVKAAVLGFPTIIINSPFTGDAFYELLQGVTQPCIVQFDEFEKVYDEEAQAEILTLLDGVFQAKKLFILTCNDVYRIDDHMMNRPGRIFYSLTFKGISLDFVREYCQDNLDDKQYIENVCTVSTMFSKFNFDMLKALVEEMNRYDESADQALEMLNVKAFSWDNAEQYSYELFVDDVQVENHMIHDKDRVWNSNPITEEKIRVGYFVPKSRKPSRKINRDAIREYDPDDDAEKDHAHDDYCVAEFNTADLKKVGDSAGMPVYTFTNNNKEKVVFTRLKEKTFSYRSYF